MIFIEYPKCSTCKKAKDFLTSLNLVFETRHIVANNPTYEEIEAWHKQSGLDIKKFFNTSGLRYKELCLKDKLSNMTIEEKYKVLASDGMLLKRPIFIADDKILIAKEIYALV